MQPSAPADGHRVHRLLPWPIWWLGGLLGCLAFALLGWWQPGEDLPTICLIRQTTGIDCPGCGMTRALSHLARGDLAESISQHPLAPILAAEALLLWAIWGAWVGLRLPLRRGWFLTLLLGNCLLLFIVWLLRLGHRLSN